MRYLIVFVRLVYEAIKKYNAWTIQVWYIPELMLNLNTNDNVLNYMKTFFQIRWYWIMTFYDLDNNDAMLDTTVCDNIMSYIATIYITRTH